MPLTACPECNTRVSDAAALCSNCGKPLVPPARDPTRHEQFKLIYDYIKFHIGLYLATPAVIGLLGRTFGVDENHFFRWGLVAMIVIYFVAGCHAGWFMGTHINTRWDSQSLSSFEAEAYTLRRRIFHHWSYWLGLGLGLAGLIAASCS